jgi:hypothetical protein
MRFKKTKHEPKRRRRTCWLCGQRFAPPLAYYRVCQTCMDWAARRPPTLEGRRFVHGLRLNSQSYVERMALGISDAGPDGRYQVIDVGRLCDALNMALSELAGIDGYTEFPSPPAGPRPPAGASEENGCFIRAVQHQSGWRGAVGRADNRGRIVWRPVGTFQSTEREAIRLARRAARREWVD